MDHAQYFNTMKNQILSEEFYKMQKLAGIITESQSYITELNANSDDYEFSKAWDSLDRGTKEMLIEPFTDDGDATQFINLGLGEMPADMSDNIKQSLIPYGTGMDAEDFSYDDSDYEDDDIEIYSESKISKLRKFIREEIEKTLQEALPLEFTSIESALNDFYDSYLAKDLRLSKEITPEERIERLQSFVSLLKSYIGKLNSGIEEEEFWISKNQDLNEGYKLESGEQKIIDDLFAQWKKDKNNTKKYKEEYKKLSISAKNKLQGMISHEREESGKY